jgi:hypothetical protein
MPSTRGNTRGLIIARPHRSYSLQGVFLDDRLVAIYIGTADRLLEAILEWCARNPAGRDLAPDR